MMGATYFSSISEKYNGLVLRERVLVLFLTLAVVFFFWYMIFGLPLEQSISSAKAKRENMLTLSESIMASYQSSEDKKSLDRNIAIIDNRISSVKSKMQLIEEEITRFNNETIAIGEIVLLLKDLLQANQDLSLESLKVYPAEVIKKKNNETSSFEDAFEKNVIALELKGSYSSVFDYLKKIETLKWSVFWQDVKYSVQEYPMASVQIQLYTLSIIESAGGNNYAVK